MNMFDYYLGVRNGGGGGINGLPVETVSDAAVATIDDGANDVPVKALTVNIEAVQSGSGDPFPAGAGKNRFDGSQIATTAPSNWDCSFANDTVNVTQKGSSSGAPRVPLALDAGQEYCISWKAKTGTVAIKININGSDGQSISKGHTFTPSEGDIIYVVFANGSGTVTEFQVEAGSTATAYAPYGNERPISGWTEADIEIAGKNLLKGMNDKTVIYTSTSKYTQVTSTNAPLMFAALSALPRGVRLYPKYDLTDDGEPIVSPDIIYLYQDSLQVATLRYDAGGIIPFDATWDRARIYSNQQTSTEKVFSNFRVGLSQADVDAYAPYNGNTYTIDLDGTIYGGTLDVINGGLTNTKIYYADLSVFTWTYKSTYGFWVATAMRSIIEHPSSTSDTANIIADRYVTASYASLRDTAAMLGIAVDTNGDVYIRNGSSDTPPAGAIVITRATPTTADLTPAEVKTLKGVNNIWANCGNVTVQYRADVELYTDKRINGLMDSFADRSLAGDIVLTNPANIGSYAFYGCADITSVTIKTATMCTLAGVSAFTGCTSLAHIYVPSALVDTYKADATWSTYSGLIEAIP